VGASVVGGIHGFYPSSLDDGPPGSAGDNASRGPLRGLQHPGKCKPAASQTNSVDAAPNVTRRQRAAGTRRPPSSRTRIGNSRVAVVLLAHGRFGSPATRPACVPWCPTADRSCLRVGGGHRRPRSLVAWCDELSDDPHTNETHCRHGRYPCAGGRTIRRTGAGALSLAGRA
jgi:hypothetical protein